MSKPHKICCIVLWMLLLSMLLISCSPRENAGANPTVLASSTPSPLTLRIYFNDGGCDMSDAPLVNQKINEYLMPLMGFQVDIQYLPNSSYRNTIGQKSLSTESFDILYCRSLTEMEHGAREGWLMPLDSLLSEFGQGITDLFSAKFLSYFRVDQSLYAIPTNHERASATVVEYNTKIAQECGIDMNAVHSLHDLTTVFETVKNIRPDVTPLAIPRPLNWDPLGDGLGVLIDLDVPLVSNLYESDLFLEYAKLAHEWFTKGYVLDSLAYSGSTTDYLGSGLVFCSINPGKPGLSTQESRTTGLPIADRPLTEPQATSDALMRGFLAISASSVHPNEAMQFLNLMYTDSTLANLIVYGIEGIHYRFVNEEKTVIGFPEGINVSNSGYAKLLPWQYANQYLTHAWEGDPPDIWQQTENFNRSAKVSIAFGFHFDPAPVAAQMEACKKIKDQMHEGILYGFLDPGESLPKMLDALNQAGISDIIAEKQRQLDAWLKNKDPE